MIVCAPRTVSADGNGNVHVWVTEKGTKYHDAEHYQNRYRTEMTLEEAIIDGYEKCLNCKAPVYTGTAKPVKDRKEYPGGGNNSKNNSIQSTPSKTTNSAENNSIPPTVSKDNQVKEVSTKEPSDNSSYANYAIGGAVVLGTLGYLSQRKKRKIEAEKEEEIRIAQKRKEEALKAEEWQRKHEEYYKLYANKDPIDLVDKPNDAFIKNGLPATKGKRIYGKYTVYVSKTGRCFHMNPHCAGNGNLFFSNYYYQYNKQMCKKCVKGNLPEIQWYKDYLKIKNIKSKYKIP